MQKLGLLVIVLICVACGSDPIPKPKGMLRLDYPNPKYTQVTTQLPFTFERNVISDPVSELKIARDEKSVGIDVTYPGLKGTIFLTYKKVDETNLEALLVDAQNMTLKHTQKADEIEGNLYENPADRVYGMFYEVGGNAASQSQFYVTDSINHFITGSLYFYAKPNYDSILPAAHYLKRDIQHLMETITWKE
ncbi:MAG: gliding motility lipoprotein GldD [Flavobacteriaceae bacterium]|nr:gliding motility lipoprotein GldD [Flavobacteriaceae bacterium]